MNAKVESRLSPVDQAVEGMLAEWKHGMLAFWTLSLILQRPMYGLEISKAIEASTQGKLRLGASTIYPLLRRLERRGLLSRRWQPSSEGPRRAYYHPTPAGREVVQRFVVEVLAPGSPIAAALNEVSARLFDQFADTPKGAATLGGL